MAGETLLIVDDDTFMRDLIHEALTEDGYTVIAEETGSGAVSALNHHEFQVALVDLSLPDTTGMELVKTITDTSPETHIIIMTGYPSLDTAIEAIRQGARDYIVKPFKLPELRGAVDRSLRTRILEEEVARLRQRVRELEGENHPPRAPESKTPQAPRRTAALPGGYGGAAPARSIPEKEEGAPDA